ncbi:preprotein translocase subunit SecA [Rickettsiales bacterium Ac37b]|nr:preprotein translocase subunit SecA [Rickettsiales bacterium Ac37b]
MSINLLGLFFDPEYYYTTSCLNQECEVSTALQHYIENAASKCTPPNEYFVNNNVLLYQQNQPDQCIIDYWVHKPFSENIENYNHIIKSFIKHIVKNNTQLNTFKEHIHNFLEKSPSDLEVLLGKANIDILLRDEFAQKLSHELKESSILYFEEIFKNKLDKYRKLDDKILTILLNYAEKFADNDSHAKFLAKAACDNADFSDKLIGTIKAKNSLVSESAIKRNNYLLEGLLESVGEYLGLKTASHPSKITLLERTVESLTGKGYDLPLNFIAKITDYYNHYVTEFNDLVTKPQVLDNKAKIDAHLKLLDQYNNESSPLIQLIYSVVRDSKHLPTKLLEKAISSSLDLVKISDAAEVAKGAIAIFEHLFTYKVLLPKDILTYFSKMLGSEDIHLQRLALKLYKHLSTSYQVNDIDSVLKADGNINNKLDILDIIVNLGQDYIFTPAQQEKIIKLEEAKEQYEDSRGYRVLNEIFEEIKSKDPAAWENKIEQEDEKEERQLELRRKESRLAQHLHRVLKLADWPMEFLCELAKAQNKDTIHIFEQVLVKISNYQLSLRLINRAGENIAEIIQNQEANSWIESINQLYRENNVTIEKTEEELIKSIKIDDQSCLELNAENCELLTNLNKEQIEYLKTNLENITRFEQQYGFKLYYDNVPNSDNQEIRLFIQDNKLYIQAVGIGKIALRGAGGEDGGISLSLYNKLKDELESKLQEGELRLTNAEERALMGFLTSHGYSGPKKLSTWNDEEFEIWKKEHVNKISLKNLGEILAILKEAVYRTSADHYYPRKAQILSVLMMYQASSGRIVQVSTGEGKSTILAMLASLKVLDGKRVDILTSTSNLAERDCGDQISFYKLLGISSGHNIRREQGLDPLKECYNYDVVYGDMLNYVGDSLSDLSFNVKNGRGNDVIIIDEADHMFVDNSNMKVQKSGPIPGFESFGQILIYMWGIQNIIIKSLGYEAYKAYLEDEKALVLDEKTYSELVKFIKKVPEELVEQVKELTLGVAYNEILKQIALPKHVEKFIAEHLPRWVNATINTRSHIENTTYVVRNVHYYNSTSNYHIIAPVDQSTGIVQYNMNWSDGVTQFLQILHAIKLTPESLTSVFQSYVSYLLKYKGHIYGATGTAGTDSHHLFINHVYGVDVAVMPNFMPKKLTMFPEMVSYDDQAGWLSNIEYSVHHNTEVEKRPVLIVARNIEEMQLIASSLREEGYTRVLEYGDYTDEANIKKKLETGDI